MRKLSPRCGVVLSLLMLTACDPSTRTPALAIDWWIDPNPPRVGEHTIVLTANDSSSRPVLNAQVVVEGNMLHPGMLPVRARATEQGGGTYSARLLLAMAGDWIFDVRIKQSDGSTIQQDLARVVVLGVGNNK